MAVFGTRAAGGRSARIRQRTQDRLPRWSVRLALFISAERFLRSGRVDLKKHIQVFRQSIIDLL